MMAFEDGGGGVSLIYSSFVPARARAEMIDRLVRYGVLPKISASVDSHSKFAIRSFLVRRTRNERDAQELIVIARERSDEAIHRTASG
jgi:hypothetical protein